MIELRETRKKKLCTPAAGTAIIPRIADVLEVGQPRFYIAFTY